MKIQTLINCGLSLAPDDIFWLCFQIFFKYYYSGKQIIISRRRYYACCDIRCSISFIQKADSDSVFSYVTNDGKIMTKSY